MHGRNVDVEDPIEAQKDSMWMLYVIVIMIVIGK